MIKAILYGIISATALLSGLAPAEDAKKPATDLGSVNVANTLKGNIKILEDDKYAPAKVDPAVTHYVVYYTASW